MRGRASTITLTLLSSVKISSLFRAHLILALGLCAAACGSKPSPPGPLENVGGSFADEPDGSTPAGSGGGGSGGAGGDGVELDAGLPDAAAPDADTLDAGPDARAPEGDAAPVVERGCVLSTLAERCDDGCPALDEAPSWLFADDPVAVVRRRCEGADGTRYVTIGGSFGYGTTGYVYDAESSELVSSYRTSDVAELCDDTTPSAIGFYGRVIHDCASVNPDDISTPCDEDSSGPGNGGDSPEACIYSDD